MMLCSGAADSAAAQVAQAHVQSCDGMRAAAMSLLDRCRAIEHMKTHASASQPCEATDEALQEESAARSGQGTHGGYVGLWPALHAYYRLVVACQQAVLQRFLFTRHASQTLRGLGERISALLQSTVKALVHEEFKVYEVALEMLAALGEDMDVLLINKGGQQEAGRSKRDPCQVGGASESSMDTAMDTAMDPALWIEVLRAPVAMQGCLRYLELFDMGVASQHQGMGAQAWSSAVVLVTFDRFLHLVDASYEQTDPCKPPAHDASLLLSVDLRNTVAEPLFIPRADCEHAFELRLLTWYQHRGRPAKKLDQSASGRAKSATADGAQPRWGTGLGSTLRRLGEPAAVAAAAPSMLQGILFVCSSEQEVARWVSVCAQPFLLTNDLAWPD